MNAEFDLELSGEQWEALKALRGTLTGSPVLNRFVVESLVALELATTTDDCPAITPRGRHVLLRGSPRLWDVAA
ncbi:MAG TPA: hypothetical protein VGM09_04455 [Bradyrhizobium sp.]